MIVGAIALLLAQAAAAPTDVPSCRYDSTPVAGAAITSELVGGLDDARVMLVLTSPEWADRGPSEWVPVELDMGEGDGERHPAMLGWFKRDGKGVLAIETRPGFLEAFERARVVGVASREGEIVRVPVNGAAAGPMRDCVGAAMSALGIDMAARGALKRPPSLDGQLLSLVSPQDYPSAALREGASGAVVVRFTVDPDGKAGDCQPVIPAHPALNSATCAAIARGRYLPALGQDGAPAAAQMLMIIRWLLPN